jgi:hypothetical protein
MTADLAEARLAEATANLAAAKAALKPHYAAAKAAWIARENDQNPATEAAFQAAHHQVVEGRWLICQATQAAERAAHAKYTAALNAGAADADEAHQAWLKAMNMDQSAKAQRTRAYYGGDYGPRRAKRS